MPGKEKLTRREFLAKAARATAGLATSLWLPKEGISSPAPEEEEFDSSPAEPDLHQYLVERLEEFLPENQDLNPQEEFIVERIIKVATEIPVKFRLEGKRLPAVFGLMGTEQHLKRCFDDRIIYHFEPRGQEMTTDFGAFGRFANYRGQLTREDIQKERYCLAVQYMYTPEWEELEREFKLTGEEKYLKAILELKDWWKYRKMLVVNPENGRVLVAIVADAGPHGETEKQFGGSPEAMDFLGLYGGLNKGEVLVGFVDDPYDKIPLGLVIPPRV